MVVDDDGDCDCVIETVAVVVVVAPYNVVCGWG